MTSKIVLSVIINFETIQLIHAHRMFSPLLGIADENATQQYLIKSQEVCEANSSEKKFMFTHFAATEENIPL